MKTILCTLSIFSTCVLSNLSAQTEAPQQEGDQPQGQLSDIKDLPTWVVDLSNLPKDAREAYITNFTKAKDAYKASRWLECIALLNTCELIYNKNPNVDTLLAGCYIEQGDFESALEVSLKSLELAPNDTVVQLNLSSIYLGTAQFQKCIEMLDEVLLTVNPRSQTDIYNILLYRKFLCLLMLDKNSEARELVKHTRPMDETPLYYFSQGTLYLTTGDRLNAKRELDSADRIFENYPLLRAYHKGLVLSGAIPKFIKTEEE